MFKKAENTQGYLKAAIMGFPGSGKTYTASLIAIGVHKFIDSKKPIFAIDSEKGLDYLISSFERQKIELQVVRTRAFIDLLEATEVSEKNGNILIIDSITHFWQDLIASFLRKQNRKTLRIQDWGQLKAEWSRFTTLFLNSNLQIIMCARAADDYESAENEEGRLEYHKVGTKMQSEKNLGFEAGLLIEMERVPVGEFKKGKRNFVNRAHILKDRFDLIDGQYFDNPTFDNFNAHVIMLNVGNHEGILPKDSQELFDKDSDKAFYEKKKQIEIYKEEIMGCLSSAYPGRSAEEIKAKTDLIQECFGTRSWLAMDDMRPDDIKQGLLSLKSKLGRNAQAGNARIDNAGIKEKENV